jgi:hypothetical protein
MASALARGVTELDEATVMLDLNHGRPNIDHRDAYPGGPMRSWRADV